MKIEIKPKQVGLWGQDAVMLDLSIASDDLFSKCILTATAYDEDGDPITDTNLTIDGKEYLDWTGDSETIINMALSALGLEAQKNSKDENNG